MSRTYEALVNAVKDALRKAQESGEGVDAVLSDVANTLAFEAQEKGIPETEALRDLLIATVHVEVNRSLEEEAERDRHDAEWADMLATPEEGN